MSRTVIIWTACVALGLLIAVAQKMLFGTSPTVGLATIALFMVGAGPIAGRVAARLETPRSRRHRSTRAMVI